MNEIAQSPLHASFISPFRKQGHESVAYEE